jgi:hypothetical protein
MSSSKNKSDSHFGVILEEAEIHAAVFPQKTATGCGSTTR